MTSSVQRSTLVLATVAIAAACSSSSSPKVVVPPPDGAQCTVGALAINGAASTGTISTSMCQLYSTYQSDSTYSASYAIKVTAGTLYQVRDSLPASIHGNASLVLVGKDSTDTTKKIVLAEAQAETPNNEDGIWFYATKSGTYSLRVSSTDTSDHNPAYSVNAVSCPIVHTMAAADTAYGDSASTLGATGCTQLFTFFNNDDSSVVKYYLVQFAAGQTRYINVYSTDFESGWYIGGADFNAMADVDGGSSNDDWAMGAGSYDSFTADSAGTYTLAVGSDSYGGTGSYSVTILPASLVLPSRVARVLQSGPRVVKLRQQQRVHILR
jgi:hypothetical protein